MAGGVKLIFRIEDRERLLSIDYVGLKRISKSDIQERIDRDRMTVRKWKIKNAKLPQTSHTISQTRDWVVIVDNGRSQRLAGAEPMDCRA